MINKMMKTVALWFCISGACGAAPVIGETAPSFTGTNMTGNTVSLEAYRGRPVVLEWTNHQCPYVRKHYGAGNMQRTQATLTQDGAVWLSVISSAPGEQGHVSEAEAQALTVKRGAYATTVILDPTGEIGRLYAARTTPQMVLIDAEGIVRYMGAIDDRPSTRASSLEGATNHLLAAWSDMKAGRAVATPQTKPYGCSVKYADE